jgi:hypothetical protein
MIHGTDIQLINASGAETVSNVLIGEPSETELIGHKISAFTLAIPKNDVHDWLDRKVIFFGNTFRTVGHPQQGMDENIPLCWNKKVRAELLLTNGNCTVYEKDSLQRHSYSGVLISDLRGGHTMKTGEQPKGELTIYLYAVNCTDHYVPKAGDMIVPSDCWFDFDTSTQQSASESMAEFRRTNKAFAVVKETAQHYNGRMPDIEVIA